MEVRGAKAGTAHDPCTRPHHGVGRPPKPPLLPGPGIHPHPPLVYGTSPPSSGSKRGHLFLVLAPSSAARAPGKPCLNSYPASYQFLLIRAQGQESVTQAVGRAGFRASRLLQHFKTVPSGGGGPERTWRVQILALCFLRLSFSH